MTEPLAAHLHYKEPPLLARNTGHGFVDVSKTTGSALQQSWAARGLALGDIDNDGRLDLVVTTVNGPAYILRNETRTSNHWLSVKLIGHKSNGDGIGAVITLTTSGGTQYQTVTTAGSYCSASDRRAHFGLGPGTEAKELEIRWPSGASQKLHAVRADRVITVEEPAASPKM